MLVKRKTTNQINIKEFLKLFGLDGTAIKTIEYEQKNKNSSRLIIKGKQEKDILECAIRETELRRILGLSILPVYSKIKKIYLTKEHIKFGLLMTRNTTVKKVKVKPKKTQVFKPIEDEEVRSNKKKRFGIF